MLIDGEQMDFLLLLYRSIHLIMLSCIVRQGAEMRN